MLRIGYVRLGDQDSATDTAALKAHGCQVVRAEEPPAPGGDAFATLASILDFMGEGDELVVCRLEQLAPSSQEVLEVIGRLDRRGACLHILEPCLRSDGETGRALRAALAAVATVEAPLRKLRRRTAAPQDIRDLQRAGLGPVEIARRLGVSRMTVWRKLRSAEPQA